MLADPWVRGRRQGCFLATISTWSRASALTGEGLEGLRSKLAAVLSDLWLQVDLSVSYADGELLARVRERGSVDFEYGDEDVRVTGRVPPAMAGELRRKAEAWAARPARRTMEPTGRRLKTGRPARDRRV